MCFPRGLSAALAVALVAACDFVPDPVALDELPERVTVHSILVTEHDSVSVLILRPASGEGASPGDVVDPVPGAVAEIVAPDGVIELTEDLAGAPVCFRAFRHPPDPDTTTSAGPGCYAAAAPGGVRAGLTYGLRVELPGGDLVEGEAVGLERPSIYAPANGATIALESPNAGNRYTAAELMSAWTAPGGGMARITLLAGAVFSDGEPVPEASCGASSSVEEFDALTEPVADTFRVTVLVHRVRCKVPDDSLGSRELTGWDSLRARLDVAVFDSTYASYHEHVIRGGSSVSADYASAGIEGAAGVFAGAAIAERRITLIAPEDDAQGAEAVGAYARSTRRPRGERPHR